MKAAGALWQGVLGSVLLLLASALPAELRSHRVPASAEGPLLTEPVRGSWQGQIARLSVAVQGRDTQSERLQPPAEAQGRRLAHIRWQFRLSGVHYLPAWLCHPQQCVPLPASRGVTQALAGLDAGAPLQLRFRRLPGMPVVELHDLQLLVHYR